MSSVKPNPCSCIICKKESSQLGIHTHYKRMHGSDSDKLLWKNSNKSILLKKENNKKEYYNNPKYCKECQTIICYPGNKTFCTSKCSGIFSNRERVKKGYKQKYNSFKKSVSKKFSKSKKIIDPYCKIYLPTCKFCYTKFVSSKRSLVCNKCQHLKWKNNKNQYSFKFNIFDYPELFDIESLKKIGWVSFGGKRGGRKNPNGLSRDHKVSVDEAKRFNYDPYYISHPLNCQLMPFNENNKKKTKSSISYNDLVELVDQYDKYRGGH